MTIEYTGEDIVLPHRLLLDAYPDQVRRCAGSWNGP